MLTTLPRTSATVRATLGDAAEWSTTDHLLALVADLLAAANWQRGGGKGKRPKPIERPGVKVPGRTDIALDSFDTPADYEAWRRRQTTT